MPKPKPAALTQEDIDQAMNHNAVPAVPRHGRLIPAPNSPLATCPTNIPLDTKEGKALLFNSLNPADIEINGDEPAELVARYYLVYPDVGIDPETGEEREFARTVLITHEGNTFRTTAAHAPHRIAATLDLFGPEAWEQGIHFLIRPRRSRKTGRTYHDIRIVASPGQ